MTDKETKCLADLALRDKRQDHVNKFALALLQQCKDKGLSIREVDTVIEIIKRRITETTLHDGLTL